MLDVISSPLASLHNMRELGGPIVNWIFIACAIMWCIVIERYWYFRKQLPRDTAAMLQLWNARGNRLSWASQQIRRAMISRLNSGMVSNLQVLRVLVPMCPLLGLLGTVSGMLEVFDAMAARGSADARSMASGVSEAMICTLSGLAVSITGLYPVYYFRRKVRRETELLADKFAF
ncbi:MAG TPA: MotA/TolQ/ExbB proton channel family protein [Steroidobacteraceae bacterium]|nr:MotA/TolQ/ExbB proton channel family protein [Steroidobacteraceae bacterium]